MEEAHCPECGAAWLDDQTCTEYFHMMGYWEMDGGLLDVHHLMVLCYHLQHPSLYSPEGLSGAMRLLVQFVGEGKSPQSVRRQIKKSVDSGSRKYKIKGTSQSHGVYAHPVQWTMTAADVVAGGMGHYYDSVNTWARSVVDALSVSANMAE